MNILWFIIGIPFAVLVAITFLTGFDKIAGRGPKQVYDGIREAEKEENRVSCPMCAEKILPQAKMCPFCKSTIKATV